MTTGLEPVLAVKARFGRLQADVVCECPGCSAAQVDEPPVLVPDHREQDGTGQWFAIGRWAHGFELQRILLARKQLAVSMKAAERRKAVSHDS